MKVRLKEGIILYARESDLHIHGDVLLKAGTAFELKKLCGGCRFQSRIRGNKK